MSIAPLVKAPDVILLFLLLLLLVTCIEFTHAYSVVLLQTLRLSYQCKFHTAYGGCSDRG
jgi:hypothetical protein